MNQITTTNAPDKEGFIFGASYDEQLDDLVAALTPMLPRGLDVRWEATDDKSWRTGYYLWLFDWLLGAEAVAVHVHDEVTEGPDAEDAPEELWLVDSAEEYLAECLTAVESYRVRIRGELAGASPLVEL